MARTISIGNQSFEEIREKGYFLVDKTNLIKEWWESADSVTLITRPRRFGKTINMDMLNCFFSNRFQGRGDLFEGLSIWKEEVYRRLQGSYPVIFLSFADVKQNNCKDAIQKIKTIITGVYRQFFDTQDKLPSRIVQMMQENMSDVAAQSALQILSEELARRCGKKVLIFLDEYDTPMQEAYLHGYWDEFTGFIRGLFNSTFKSNFYMERGIMTGITRVSKESVFSDLNNLTVVTTTSEKYASCFGFTQQEVTDALDEYGLEESSASVRQWYNGFTFGSHRDIYNPWSITNFLKEKRLFPYWASTSSNGLASKLIRTASADLKEKMETLLNGQSITVNFDEQIVYSQLDENESAIWSLLTASGYLKIENIEYKGIFLEPWYTLRITNLETVGMFSAMFRGWFSSSDANYNGFVRALLSGNLKEMNLFMNDVALATFSAFDTGKHPSARTQPERFYHGFVLGLLVELRGRYSVQSNKESGYGRYDICLIPQKTTDPAIVLEFKVHDPDEENTLQETVESALKQIEEKAYDSMLVEHGISKKQIRHYGFAFEGKKVLIGSDEKMRKENKEK